MNIKTLLFIGISAILHISVIFIIADNTRMLDLNEQGSSLLPIEITKHETKQIADHKLDSEARTQSKEINNSRQNPTRTVSTLTKNSKIKQNLSDTDSSDNPVQLSKPNYKEKPENTETPSQPTQKSRHDKEINRTEIASILQSELTKFFYYPKAAQRKNWEGLVILSFTILPSGVINDITINTSSGYSALDNAAIHALKKFDKQSELALAVNGNILPQLLPVNYKLTY